MASRRWLQDRPCQGDSFHYFMLPNRGLGSNKGVRRATVIRLGDYFTDHLASYIREAKISSA